MNYYQMPYESDYSEDGTKMGGQSQRASSMPMLAMPGAGMNMNMSPMQMPMGNMSQMGQMPMSSMSQMSYPMQQPQQMGMMQPMPSMQSLQSLQPMQSMQSMQPMQPMQQGQGQMTMSPVSMPTMSQLPPGAVTPLNSMTMMPVMGGIDGSGMNVVVPDLQPLSAMSQMSPNNQMSQMGHMPQMQQHQQQQHQNSGRLSGGSSGGVSNWMNYSNNGAQMMPNNNAWNYSQGYPSAHSMSPQQQQQQQQQPRMKSQYDYATNTSGYREARNGLNSPTMQDSLRFSRSSSDGKKVPHWR